jgi:NAD-dependent dihydropyrimidine dehydrogenase PreA subunit
LLEVRDEVGPFEIDIRHEWCKGCDICSRVCPEYCLAVDVDGVLRIVDGESCTGCRLCEMLCPDFAIAIQPAATALTSESRMR